MNTPHPVSIRARTAMEVLFTLDAAGVEHCVLRNHEQIHNEPGRDIDLVARDAELPRVEEVLVPIARREGWDRLLKCSGHHEGTSYYLVRSRSGGVDQLEFHFTRVRWAGLPIIRIEEVLARRIRSQSGIWVADPAQVAVQRLLQFGFSGQLEEIKDDYWIQTREQVRESHDKVTSELAAVMGDRDVAARMVKEVNSDSRQGAAELIRQLRRSFVLRRVLEDPASLPRAVTKNVARVFESWRPARCGVVGVTRDESSVRALKTAITPMFLDVRVEESVQLDQKLVRSVSGTVSRAGAALIVSPHPDYEIRRRAWGATAVLLPDQGIDHGIRAVTDRFSANHELL